MILKTTLNDIRKHAPCESGWKKLLKYLNKTSPDDEPLDFKTILNSNGIDDALWCLRSTEGYDKEIRLYAVWCARQVERLDKTGTSKNTNDISEKFAYGLATGEDLAAASDAAYAAASAAAASAAAYAAAARAATYAATYAAASAAAASAAARDAQKEEFIKRFCTE